jgi:hypothetical protein
METMTDLRSRDAATGADAGSRPTAIAAVGAVLAVGVGLVLCVGVAALGWLGGNGGSLAGAARAGADAWLLAHGSGLEVDSTTITVVPVGLLTLVAGVVCALARWVARVTRLEDARSLVVATTTMSGCYAALATVTAVVSATDTVTASPARALVGALLVANVAGGLGLASEAGLLRSMVASWPHWLRAVSRGGVAVVALLIGAGALLTVVALLGDLGQAATMAEKLEAGVLGGVVLTVAQALLLPNAALLAVSYLVGPGFMFGAGTAVAPSGVSLGQVPAVPMLVALPADGPSPWWAMGLLATPVVAGMVGAVVALRAAPVPSVVAGMLRGALAGSAGGAAAGLLTALGGGAVGPGRLADVGAMVWQCAGVGGVAAGLGGIVAAAVHGWWTRR